MSTKTKRRLFYTILVAIFILFVSIIFQIINARKEKELTFDPQLNSEGASYVKVSTKPWADMALFENIDPSIITSISFVDKYKSGFASKAWAYDGISCYFKQGTVYIAVGNGIKVTGSMNGAFRDLPKLQTITGLSLLDTSEVLDMSYLFAECPLLSTVPIGEISTNSVLLAEGMFENCSGLVSIDMSGNQLENALDLDRLFYQCESLESIKLPKTKEVVSAKEMFYKVGIQSPFGTDVGGMLDLTNCEDISHMFNSSKLTNYKMAESFDTESLQTAEGLFYNCSIEEINLSQWDTKNLKNTKNMFNGCAYLNNCNVSSWDMASLNNCEGMFSSCPNLSNMELNWINVPPIVQNAAYMFKKCYFTNSIDLSCFDNTYFGDAREMFYACEDMETIYGFGFQADVADRAFTGCKLLNEKHGIDSENIDLQTGVQNGYFTTR